METSYQRQEETDVRSPEWTAECDHGECFGGKCLYRRQEAPCAHCHGTGEHALDGKCFPCNGTGQSLGIDHAPAQPQALMQMGVLFHDCHPACEECRFNVVTGTVRFPGGIEDIDSRCTGLPHECAALLDSASPAQCQKEDA